MGYAVVLGVFGAFAGLIFIGVIKFGGNWYSDSHPGCSPGRWVIEIRATFLCLRQHLAGLNDGRKAHGEPRGHVAQRAMHPLRVRCFAATRGTL